MRPRSMLAFALALASALAPIGCLRVGPGEDLHLVCERETTSPWHPYAPDELEQVARIDGGPTPEQRLRLFTDAANRLLTQGARAYDTFEAHLYPIGGGVWRFDANGTFGNATDSYALELPPLNETVFAPPILVTQAHAIAARTPSIQGETAELRRATWDFELAACIQLEYASGTTAWVNLDEGRVVSHTST